MTTSFGKRDPAKPPGSAPIELRAATSTADEGAVSASDGDPPTRHTKSWLDRFPLMTIAITTALLVIFYGVEQRYAFSMGVNGDLDYESLLAMGGASGYRVVDRGEWWRVFLAPVLHLSPLHVISNCIAMLLVGFRLEAIIGRAWIAAIFAVSGLGGEAISLVGDQCLGASHYGVGIGASGAIMGLVSALFVASFHCASNSVQLRWMLLTSGLIGLPALLPLTYYDGVKVGYFAHFGGAVAGAWLMLAVLGLGSEKFVRPKFQGLAALAASAGVLAALGAGVFAWNRFAAEAERVSRFIPIAELRHVYDGDPPRVLEVLRRHPDDPRAHVAQAIVHMDHRPLTWSDLSHAESEFRLALALDAPEEIRQPFLPFVKTRLGAIVAQQGHRDEAKRIVADLCPDSPPIDPSYIKLLYEYRLCG
jgi:membrane associated rhomboid family serine protease